MRNRPRFLPVPTLLLGFVALSACSDAPTSAESDPPRDAVSAAAECAPPADIGVLASRIASLEGEVDSVERSGAINQGQAEALRSHLANAARQLEAAAYCAVYAQLAVFRQQLETFADESDLPDRDLFELRLRSRLALGPQAPVTPGQEEYAPGVVGEIRTVDVNGETVTYEVIDGLALLNSDLILGFADEFEAAAAGGGTPAIDPPLPTGAPGAASPPADGPEPTAPCFNSEITCARWDGGVIGYDYFPDWGIHTPFMIGQIQQAIAQWREETGIEFVRRSSGQRIIFRNGSGCSSWLGRNPYAIFDPQYVFLKYEGPETLGCGNVGTIVHEIGHAIGLHHEQNRNDREGLVSVDFGAIASGKEHNFYRCGGLCRTVGGYDFESIMHYPCDSFQRDGVTRNTLTPLRGGVDCATLGQRDALSEGDVLGAYTLYQPRFRLVGAEDGDVGDRFVIQAVFDGETPPDQYLRWNAAGGTIRRTGPSVSTLEMGLPEGPVFLVLSFVVDEVILQQEIVRFTIANDAPVVDVGSDRTVPMNRMFSVSAAVTDTEDGACPISICSFAWTPTPAIDGGGTAQFIFPTVPAGGTATIGVTVTDGFGEAGADELVVTVVDSPPVPVITLPNGSSYSSGATVAFSGYATDANYGPGPGAGTLPCTSLSWASSDPSDVLPGSPTCDGSIVFGDPGPRTLTLTASDGTGNTSAVDLDITVDGCSAGGCAPDASIVLETPSELDGALYSPPFTGPGYLLDTPIDLSAPVTDVDTPPTSIAVEWRVRLPGLGGGGPEIVIGSTGLFPPSTTYLTWTPSDDIAPWSGCGSTALPHVIILEVTDVAGNSRTVEQTIHLACFFG